MKSETKTSYSLVNFHFLQPRNQSWKSCYRSHLFSPLLFVLFLLIAWLIGISVFVSGLHMSLVCLSSCLSVGLSFYQTLISWPGKADDASSLHSCFYDPSLLHPTGPDINTTRVKFFTSLARIKNAEIQTKS